MSLLERYKSFCPDFTPASCIRQAIRVNTLKISEDLLVKRLETKKVRLEKIPFLNSGYYASAGFSLGATPEYLQGYYYIQEAASQIPAEVLNPLSADTVLDMACAPGSKLTHIAQLMQNKGILVGLDIDEKRLLSVRNNCARLGITNTILYKLDSRKASCLGVKFDKVLLDAPCSGNYCTEPGFFQKRRKRDFENRAELQKQLLKSASGLVKPGGTLLYSTCSLEPEENEMVVDWAIRSLDIKLEQLNIGIGDPGLTKPFAKRISPEVSKCIRLWPHKTGTQGFFMGLFRKLL